MANTINIPKSHLIMGLCLPLAVLLGYLMAEPLDSATLGVIVFVLVILGVPLFMKWHHPLLVLSWNAWVVPFFLPGSPSLWMIMAFTSLLFALLNRSVSPDNKFIFVPSIAKPLIFLLMVVLATALCTGGVGLRSLGAEHYGGRGYFYIIAAVAGFFAFTSQRIPPERVGLFLAMFFLASFTPLIGTLTDGMGSKLFYVHAIFSMDSSSDITASPTDLGNTHFGSLCFLGHGLYCYLLARYGLRGVLAFSKPWRGLLLLLAATGSLAGGFRGAIIMLAAIVAILFWLEGLHRTQYLFIGLVLVIAAAVVVVPLARRLPPSVQRTLSFLPLDIDPVVKESATTSTDWRLEMWKIVVPEVPKYLLKGKGYAVDPGDLYMSAFGSSVLGAALSGDYHNGPLTLIIPFGIFGVIGFTWFVVASFRYLLYHHRFGDPHLKNINTFLLVVFAVHLIFYIFLFGNFYTDLPVFVGLIGFSISLNGEASLQVKEPAATELLETLVSS